MTYASPIPDEPGVGGGVGPLASGVGPIAAIVAPIAPGATPVPGDQPVPSPVPEPAAWLLLIVGVGAIGATLRRPRKGFALAGGLGTRASRGAALWSGSAAVEAGDVAATAVVKSTVASVAGKAMMCVCPAALVAGSVVGVPPVRHAVHEATAPATPLPRVAASITAPPPCLESLPVSTIAIKGFPDTVTTTAVSTGAHDGAQSVGPAAS